MPVIALVSDAYESCKAKLKRVMRVPNSRAKCLETFQVRTYLKQDERREKETLGPVDICQRSTKAGIHLGGSCISHPSCTSLGGRPTGDPAAQVVLKVKLESGSHRTFRGVTRGPEEGLVGHLGVASGGARCEIARSPRLSPYRTYLGKDGRQKKSSGVAFKGDPGPRRVLTPENDRSL